MATKKPPTDEAQKKLFVKTFGEYQKVREEIIELKTKWGINRLETVRRDLDRKMEKIAKDLGVSSTELRKEFGLGKGYSKMLGNSEKIKQEAPPEGEEDDEDLEAGYELEYEEAEEDLYESDDDAEEDDPDDILYVDEEE